MEYRLFTDDQLVSFREWAVKRAHQQEAQAIEFAGQGNEKDFNIMTKLYDDTCSLIQLVDKELARRQKKVQAKLKKETHKSMEKLFGIKRGQGSY